MDNKLKFIASYHFSVTFLNNDDSHFELSFRDVTGISLTQQTEEVHAGGENNITYSLPKGVKASNIRLSRATGASEQIDIITSWAERAINFMDISLKTVMISLMNEKHQPVRTWSFIGAYPVLLSISDLDASKNELSIETLELAYKYMRRDK